MESEPGEPGEPGEPCVALGRRRPQTLRTHTNTFSNDLLHALRAFRARQRRTRSKASAELAIETLAQPGVALHWLPSDLLAHICGFLLHADAAAPNAHAGAVPLTLRVRSARAAAESLLRLQRSSKWADASLRALPDDGYDALRFEAMARLHTLRGGIEQLATEARSSAHVRMLRYALTQELLHCAGRDDCPHYCGQWRRDLNAYAAEAGSMGTGADPWSQLTESVRHNLNAPALTSDAIVQLGLGIAPSGRKMPTERIPWMARAAKEGVTLVAVPSAADHAFLYSGGEGGPSNGPDASCVTIVFPEPSTAWGNGRDMVARRRIPLGAALAAVPDLIDPRTVNQVCTARSMTAAADGAAVALVYANHARREMVCLAIQVAEADGAFLDVPVIRCVFLQPCNPQGLAPKVWFRGGTGPSRHDLLSVAQHSHARVRPTESALPMAGYALLKAHGQQVRPEATHRNKAQCAALIIARGLVDATVNATYAVLQTRFGDAVADVPEPLASEFAAGGRAGDATQCEACYALAAKRRSGGRAVPTACSLCAGVAEHGVPAYAPASLDVAPASDGAGAAVLFVPDRLDFMKARRQRAFVWLAPERRGVAVAAVDGAKDDSALANRKRWMKTHDSVRPCASADADEWTPRAVLEVDLFAKTPTQQLGQAVYAYTAALGPHADIFVTHAGRRPVSESMLLMRAHPMGAIEVLAATEWVVLYLPMRTPDETTMPDRCRRFVPTAKLTIPDTGIVWPISRDLGGQWSGDPGAASRLPHALMQFSPCGRWLLMLGGVAAERDDRNDVGLTLLDLGAWLVRVQDVGERADTGPLGLYYPELVGTGPIAATSDGADGASVVRAPGPMSGFHSMPSYGSAGTSARQHLWTAWGEETGMPLDVVWGRSGIWVVPDGRTRDRGCLFLGARSAPHCGVVAGAPRR